MRPRANIVPVHFLDLASAAEKLRWAEKEWRELDQELVAQAAEDPEALADEGEVPEEEVPEAQRFAEAGSFRSS